MLARFGRGGISTGVSVTEVQLGFVSIIRSPDTPSSRQQALPSQQNHATTEQTRYCRVLVPPKLYLRLEQIVKYFCAARFGGLKMH